MGKVVDDDKAQAQGVSEQSMLLAFDTQAGPTLVLKEHGFAIGCAVVEKGQPTSCFVLEQISNDSASAAQLTLREWTQFGDHTRLATIPLDVLLK